MARYLGPRMKRARRVGTDLSLSIKSLADKSKKRHTHPPGQHGAAAGRGPRSKSSDYRQQLLEKQKLRYTYGVLERQFRRYYAEASKRRGATGVTLLQLLETRLDNVVYRLGFASTRAEARQLVSHRGVEVNGRIVNLPSYGCRPGDTVALREHARGQERVRQGLEQARTREPVPWLTLDAERFEGRVLDLPKREDLDPQINENLVVELYSK